MPKHGWVASGFALVTATQASAQHNEWLLSSAINSLNVPLGMTVGFLASNVLFYPRICKLEILASPS